MANAKLPVNPVGANLVAGVRASASYLADIQSDMAVNRKRLEGALFAGSTQRMVGGGV